MRYKRLDVLKDTNALNALRTALAAPSIKVHALQARQGSRHVRIIVVAEEATFGLRSENRLQNSRGLTAYLKPIRQWFVQHREAFDMLFVAIETADAVG